ncbi:ParB/RepB/Spo0J family partition protein [Muribaculaceae bacterium Isolate-042 (Harlan)]|uniref:ParB/RepB/Spo0J family partition protein n=1 Tax=Xylanibacter rodentium TaxID=2736289 RepID=UPI000F4ABC00|nr:ParB/RepB/Spo0J family partition protein [Xylanibacter rodentium]ROS79654.1 ParB/RepB/Spo0J family partition protein [Muribaculaceae bacterium Isolate-042 (Harlan)]
METTAIPSANAVSATMVALANIQPNTFNPRNRFEDVSLSELAESIRQQGVIQPIALRPLADSDRYEIIYGERRYRASLIAERENIPALVYDVDDETAQEMAIAENLQREDITPTEEANAFQRLLDSGRHDVQSLAVQFGKSVNYIRSRLKFTALIPEIAQMLDADEITVSVATEICRYPDDIQREVYKSHFENANYGTWRGLKASEVAQNIENRYTTSLCRYKFDKSACALCPHNTRNLLLFTEDGDEGNCANRQCLTEKQNAHILDTALYLVKQYPTAVLLQSQYNKNEAVAECIAERGYDITEINGTPAKYPVEPVAPCEVDCNDPEEYTNIRERYENALNRYNTELERVNARLEAGEISLYIFFNSFEAYLAYMDNATASDTTKPNGAQGNTPQAEIAKLEAKDKRNKEIAVERTIEDTKKKILDADITEAKFTQDEDKMIYFFLLSSLRREHYEAVGLTDRKSEYLPLSDAEKLTIIESLNSKTKAIIRRDFLIENFKGANRDNAIGDLLISFAKKHMPEELANIEAEYIEVYEKRHERIAEKIAVFNDQIAKESETQPATEETEDTPHTEAETPQTQETAA